MAAVTPSFAAKVAAQIGAPVERVYQILSQWQPYEGGSAAFNPLNTTQGGPGVVDNYNSVGVKNFANEDAGAAATAATLLNGYYPDIVHWMKTGELNTANVVNQLRTWGTVHFANAIGGGEPSPSTGGGAAMPTSDALNKLVAIHNQLRPLEQKLTPYLGPDGKPQSNVKFAVNPTTGTYQALVYSIDPVTGQLGNPIGKDVMTAAEYALYTNLGQQYDSLYAQAQEQQMSPADAIKIADYQYGTSNKAVDAENAAKQYARDLQAANAALSASANEYQQQSANQNNKIKGYNEWAGGHMPGQSAPIPDYFLPTQQDLFDKQLKVIKANLPEVPGMPYYSPDQQNAGIGQVGYKTNVDAAIANSDQQYGAAGYVWPDFADQQPQNTPGTITGSILNNPVLRGLSF